MILIIPLSLIFLRRQPEDMGMSPDGEGNTSIEFAPQQFEYKEIEYGWSVGEAIRTKAFWMLITSLVLSGFANGGGIHRIAYWTELGFDTKLVSFAFSTDALGATIMILGAGVLFDRFPARFVTAGALAGFTLGVFFFINETITLSL